MSIVLFIFILFGAMWLLNVIVIGAWFVEGVNLKGASLLLSLIFLELILMIGIAMLGALGWRLTYLIILGGYKAGSGTIIMLLVIYFIYFIVGWIMFQYNVSTFRR